MKERETMAIKIFVDAGHNPGTINAGANVNGVLEADINFYVSKYLGDILQMDSRFEVMLSRNSITEVLGTDRNSSLRTRVEMANNWPADYFLSIHCNYNENPNINGSEVYIYRSYTQAQWLAEEILPSLVNVVQMDDNGIYVNPNLYVLRNTRMTANLIELGYLTNEGDFSKLVSEQLLFAIAIYIGLLQYFGFLN